MCKHLNGTLVEVMRATHARDVVDGVLEPEGLNDIGDITDYQFNCTDCGRSFRRVAAPRGSRAAELKRMVKWGHWTKQLEHYRKEL